MFLVFGELPPQDEVSSVHIRARETGRYAATRLNSYKLVVVPSVQVSRHPVAPFGDIHAPNLAFPGKIFDFDSLDFVVRQFLAIAEGEEVTLDDEHIFTDGDILVIIEDLSTNLISHISLRISTTNH